MNILKLGQGSVPMDELMKNTCILSNFTSPIHFYGQELGSLYGIIYNKI